MQRQRGLSLIGLIFVGALVAMAAMVVIKMTPAMMEYLAVTKIIKAIAQSNDAQGSVADIRRAYDRRATIDDTPSVTGADLEISKSGGGVTISVAYGKKIHLVGVVSLCLDFDTSSHAGTTGAP